MRCEVCVCEVCVRVCVCVRCVCLCLCLCAFVRVYEVYHVCVVSRLRMCVCAKLALIYKWELQTA